MSRVVSCIDCGEILNKTDVYADFSECTVCKSTNIEYKLSFSDEMPRPHETMRGKMKQKGIKKPTKEVIYGDDYYHKEEKWVDKKRVIDRENDKYIEIVKDKETGEIIHECDESLKEHFGHGSAKFKNKSSENRED